MAKLLDKQRYKCALGAMQTVQAISRAIPVLHSGPGCAQKLSESTGGSGYFSPNIFPCTSINEKDVVFGGVKKLETTIENAVRNGAYDNLACRAEAREKISRYVLRETGKKPMILPAIVEINTKD